MLRKLTIMSTLAVLMLAPLVASAQDSTNDVFKPISKYISQGDAESLSAWFDTSVEISVLSESGNSSKSQSKQIVKSFFNLYSPHSFTIYHTAGRANMKYAVGQLKAGGETFDVTVFINYKGGSYKIQQLKIERKN